jgi:hypothetical protein
MYRTYPNDVSSCIYVLTELIRLINKYLKNVSDCVFVNIYSFQI